MRIAFFVILLALLLCLSPRSVEAKCEDTLRRMPSLNDFWNLDSEFKVKRKGVEPQAITFGFDAELWRPQDAIHIASKTPQTKKQMAEFLGKKSIALDVREIAQRKGLTQAIVKRQLANIPELDGNYELTALPSALYEKIDIQDHRGDVADAHPIIAASMKSRGIPVKTTLETSSGGQDFAVELVMEGSQSKPKQFASLIKNFLHKEAKDPQTHFHIALPSKVVRGYDATLIARAVETKIVLDELMVEGEYPKDFSWNKFEYSSFEDKIDKGGNTVARGYARLELNRWRKPQRAHDLEIRQWLSLKHAFESIHFVATLAKSHEKLADYGDFEAEKIDDLLPANLNGALRYFAHALKNELPRNSEIPIQLERYAKSIERRDVLGSALRNKIRNYIKDERLMRYLKPALFLVE